MGQFWFWNGLFGGVFLVYVYINSIFYNPITIFFLLTIRFSFCVVYSVSMETSWWTCSRREWVRISSTIKKETFIHSTVGKWGTPVWSISVLRSIHVCASPIKWKVDVKLTSKAVNLCIVELNGGWGGRAWALVMYFNLVNFIVHSAYLLFNMRK